MKLQQRAIGRLCRKVRSKKLTVENWREKNGKAGQWREQGSAQKESPVQTSPHEREQESVCSDGMPGSAVGGEWVVRVAMAMA